MSGKDFSGTGGIPFLFRKFVTDAAEKESVEKGKEKKINLFPEQGRDVDVVQIAKSEPKGNSKITTSPGSLKEKILRMGKSVSESDAPVVKTDRAESSSTISSIEDKSSDVVEMDDLYKAIFSDFEELSKEEKIDLDKSNTIESTLKIFSTYNSNLHKVMPQLIKKFGKTGNIPEGEIGHIQSQLHTQTGSHLGRVKEPTPQKIELYFRGQLNQVKELYESAKQEGKLIDYFESCYSKLPGCFDERVQKLYQKMTQKKEAAAMAESMNEKAVRDPILPAQLDVIISAPETILAHYHNAFTQVQEEKMKLKHPELAGLSIQKQLQYRADKDLDKDYLSREKFNDFLFTTKYKELLTNQGKITDAMVDRFWNQL